MTPTAHAGQHSGARPIQALGNAAQGFLLPLGMAEPDRGECPTPPEPLSEPPRTNASAAKALPPSRTTIVAPDKALQLHHLVQGVKLGESVPLSNELAKACFGLEPVPKKRNIDVSSHEATIADAMKRLLQIQATIKA